MLKFNRTARTTSSKKPKEEEVKMLAKRIIIGTGGEVRLGAC